MAGACIQLAEEAEDVLSTCLMGRLNPCIFGRRGRADEGRQRRLGRNVGEAIVKSGK